MNKASKRTKKEVNIFIGGGTDYYGPTAERDRQVALALGLHLDTTFFYQHADLAPDVWLYYGGQKGIPEDCLRDWNGVSVAIVAASHLEELLTRMEKSDDVYGTAGEHRYIVVGERERDRRERFLGTAHFDCAIFIQGGPYTADEMRRAEAAGIPIVALAGGGGAAGGAIDTSSLDNVPLYRFDPDKHRTPVALLSTNAADSPDELAREIAEQVYAHIDRNTLAHTWDRARGIDIRVRPESFPVPRRINCTK